MMLKSLVTPLALSMTALLTLAARGDDSPPATTQPTIAGVDLLSSIYLARIEIHVTISPQGWLHYERIENKSASPQDADRTGERTQVREGQLSADQLTQLSNMFKGWDAVSDQPYGGVPDSPDIRIRYGEKTVRGGSDLPKKVLELESAIRALATAMPIAR